MTWCEVVICDGYIRVSDVVCDHLRDKSGLTAVHCYQKLCTLTQTPCKQK